MPITTMTTEHGGGSSVVSMAFRGRSFLSLRRNQVVSMEQGHEEDLHDLELFQTHVADRLLSLVPTSDYHNTNENAKSGEHQHQQQILSLPFLQKLLDALLDCEEEFKALILLFLDRNPAPLSKPPLDRAVADLLDRAVKSLDICNAISHALHSLQHWHRHADIAASALLLPDLPLGPAQLNRAGRALKKLLTSSTPHDSRHHRQESSGGGSGGRTEGTRSFGLSRTLSWGLSRNWSAVKQVQTMWANLAAPRGGDAGVGGGLALAVYTMSSLLVFAMWALVAAFPCGERGGAAAAAIPVAPPRQLAWAGAMVMLQERIAEEWRRREKKGGPPSAGLLAELQQVERCGRGLLEAVAGCAAMEVLRAEEVAGRAADLAEACRTLEEGIGPFERQVREVFHRVVGSRTEVLRCLDQNSRVTPFTMVL